MDRAMWGGCTRIVREGHARRTRAREARLAEGVGSRSARQPGPAGGGVDVATRVQPPSAAASAWDMGPPATVAAAALGG
jgi:hypothetical protein